MSILNTKTLDEIENPLQQNMKEKIQQRYNFKVKWQAGKKMMIIDALSRAPIDEAIDVDNPQIYKTATEKMIVNSIMNQDVEKIFGDQKLNNLLQKANDDQEYIALRKVVDRGFLPKKNMSAQNLKEY